MLKTGECSECDLVRVNLYRAELVGVNLREANLKRAKIQYADLTGADLLGTHVEEATFCKTTMPDGSINNQDC